MKTNKGILLTAIEVDTLGLPPGPTMSIVLRKIADDLGRHDPGADRAYSRMGVGGEQKGRWMYLVGGNSEVTQKAEAALDAMRLATDAPERELPEDPSAGDMAGWPAGKIVLFDHEGRPKASYSPQGYFVKKLPVYLTTEEAKRLIDEKEGTF